MSLTLYKQRKGNSMSDNFFAYISRMRYIERWSLMRNALPENIQEHSHMVAVIAHALGVIRRDVFHTDCDPNACAAAALYHDASEILTGDLPTPIKYYNPAIKNAYKQVEQIACQKLLATLPAELRPAFQPLLTEAEYRDIVKAADKLSALIKCIEEEKAGNKEFSTAHLTIFTALSKMQMPEIDTFIEDFLPAYSKTLDELS